MIGKAGAEHLEYLIFLAVCASLLLTWSYLIGPRRRAPWLFNLTAGSVLAGYLAAVLIGGWWEALVVKALIGVACSAAVIIGFLILLFGAAEGRTDITGRSGSLIPQVLLRPSWRDRRHRFVTGAAAVLLISATTAVIGFTWIHPDRADCDGKEPGAECEAAANGYQAAYGIVDDLCELPIEQTVLELDSRLELGSAEHVETDFEADGHTVTEMYCGWGSPTDETHAAIPAIEVVAIQRAATDAEEPFLLSVYFAGLQDSSPMTGHQWTEAVQESEEGDNGHTILLSWHENLAVEVYIHRDDEFDVELAQKLTIAVAQVVYASLREAA